MLWDGRTPAFARRIGTGGLLCTAHNLPSGCRGCHLQHVCSGCGQQGHGAQK
ncbi:hypothetical protein K523DRAFT_322503, partial [Schizophyllum commune Tattone D]